MKKLFLILVLFILSGPAFSRELYHASLEYNAESARREAFQNIEYKIPLDRVMKNRFDKDIEENKNAMKYNLKLPDRDLTMYELPFSKSYGVTFKNNPGYTYFYWHSSGYLKSVAVEAAKNPNSKDKYPFSIYRYSPNGKLVGVSFQVSPAEEYIYNKDGTLNCHWVGETANDKDGKKIGSSTEIKPLEE